MKLFEKLFGKNKDEPIKEEYYEEFKPTITRFYGGRIHQRKCYSKYF